MSAGFSFIQGDKNPKNHHDVTKHHDKICLSVLLDFDDEGEKSDNRTDEISKAVLES